MSNPVISSLFTIGGSREGRLKSSQFPEELVTLLREILDLPLFTAKVWPSETSVHAGSADIAIFLACDNDGNLQLLLYRKLAPSGYPNIKFCFQKKKTLGVSDQQDFPKFYIGIFPKSKLIQI